MSPWPSFGTFSITWSLKILMERPAIIWFLSYLCRCMANWNDDSIGWNALHQLSGVKGNLRSVSDKMAPIWKFIKIFFRHQINWILICYVNMLLFFLFLSLAPKAIVVFSNTHDSWIICSHYQKIRRECAWYFNRDSITLKDPRTRTFEIKLTMLFWSWNREPSNSFESVL